MSHFLCSAGPRPAPHILTEGQKSQRRKHIYPTKQALSFHKDFPLNIVDWSLKSRLDMKVLSINVMIFAVQESSQLPALSLKVKRPRFAVYICLPITWELEAGGSRV